MDWSTILHTFMYFLREIFISFCVLHIAYTVHNGNAIICFNGGITYVFRVTAVEYWILGLRKEKK